MAPSGNPDGAVLWHPMENTFVHFTLPPLPVIALWGFHLCSPNSSSIMGEHKSCTFPNEPTAAQTWSYGVVHRCHQHGSPWEMAHGVGVRRAEGRHWSQQLPWPFWIYTVPSRAPSFLYLLVYSGKTSKALLQVLHPLRTHHNFSSRGYSTYCPRSLILQNQQYT